MIFTIVILIALGFMLVFMLVFFIRALSGKPYGSSAEFDEEESKFKVENVAEHLKPHNVKDKPVYTEAIPFIEKEVLPQKEIKAIQYELDEYGFSPKNPIPTKSIAGTEEYLSRLETLDGDRIQYKILSHKTIEGVPMPIDQYSIMQDGHEIAVLYFNANTMINSTRPPKGFHFF